VLHDAQEPHLFVIRKQHRAAAASVDSPPHAFYYILDGSVYQVCCPGLMG
jgi:mediator of RNA polymerase II transcription subunit 6